MNRIIDVRKLRKSYGTVEAVKDVSFYVEEGSMFSFLGTNGAGKSTTISILLTLLTHDSGDVIIRGHTAGKEDDAIRHEIGAVFQQSLLDPLLTVQENLDSRARLYQMSRAERKAAIDRVSAATDISDLLKRRYGKLSGGQKRRADIARALLHQPKILLLDEPTTGLDPQNRKKIWKMIHRLRQETNMTVFLTTHYIEEAADSDYVVVLKEGRVIAKGTPHQLKADYSADRLFILAKDPVSLRKQLLADHILFREEQTAFVIQLACTTDAIHLLTAYEPHIASFEVRQSSLDDVFIRIHEGQEDIRNDQFC